MMHRHALLTALVLLIAGLALATWNRENPFLLFITTLMTGLLLSGLALPWLAVRGTRLRLATTTDTQASQTSRLLLSIHNQLPWPLEGLVLELMLDGADDRRLAARLPLPRLRPGHADIPLDLPRLTRGRYHLDSARLQCSQPFGLWTFSRPLKDAEGNIVIRPHRFPMAWQHFNLTGASDFSGSIMQSRQGMSSEFFGVREYRPGDSPRHVDWKATARQGELIVREFEDTSSPELLILMDRHESFLVSDSSREQFETCVSIAASAATAAMDAGIATGLYSQDIDHAIRKGPLHGLALLDAFTDIQPGSPQPVSRTLATLAARINAPRTLMLSFRTSRAEWTAIHTSLLTLQQKGCRLLVLLTSDDASEEQRAAATLMKHGMTVVPLSSTPMETLFR